MELIRLPGIFNTPAATLKLFSVGFLASHSMDGLMTSAGDINALEII